MFVDAIRCCLTRDLLNKKYQKMTVNNAYFGHCYIASEAYYHLYGGKQSDLQPHYVKIDDEITHWYLVNKKTKEIIDITRTQFNSKIPYNKGRACGFLTSNPSKRCKELLDRVETLTRWFNKCL